MRPDEYRKALRRDLAHLWVDVCEVGSSHRDPHLGLHLTCYDLTSAGYRAPVSHPRVGGRPGVLPGGLGACPPGFRLTPSGLECPQDISRFPFLPDLSGAAQRFPFLPLLAA